MINFEISVDDGCDQDNRIANLCRKYGTKATFYIPIDYMSLAIRKGYEPLSPSHYSSIAKDFEIGSHGVTHRYLTQIDPAEAKDEIFASKQMMENLLDRKVRKFCYPRGYYNDQIKQWVEDAGYTYARTTAIGSLEPPQDPFAVETTVHIGCPVRPEYKGTTWLDYAIEKLEEAQNRNRPAYYHAWCHSWEVSKYNEWENVKKFFRVVHDIHS